MGNVHMEATQVNYREGNKKMSVAEAIKNAGSEITPEEKAWIDTIPELASQEIIAPEFDAESGVYAVGDLVIHNGGLYQFTTEHDPAGAWDAEEVAEVKVSDELSSLKSGLTNLIVTHSYTKNSDTAGRVIIPLPLDDIISVKVSSNYGYFLRYLSEGNQTLLYMRDPDTWLSIGEVSDISITVKALS